MSIKDRRLKKVADSIIKEELQSGHFPSSGETLTKVNSYVNQHDLSLPSLTINTAISKQIATADQYMDILDQIEDDLSTLYSSSIILRNQASVGIRRYEVDRLNLIYQLDQLEYELEEKLLLNADAGVLNSVYDRFLDMQQINTGATTASIKLQEHEITLSESGSKKIDIPAATTVSFTRLSAGSTSINYTAGNLVNILNPYSTEVWVEEILSGGMNDEVGGYISIDFGSTIITNKIILSLHTVKPVTVKIVFTPDYSNWLDLPNYEGICEISDQKTFNFDDIGMKAIKIIMTKDEYDSNTIVDGGEKYIYTFGVRSIGFFQTGYATESALMTTPLMVNSINNFSVNKVSLSTNDFIPNGTSIDYYVGLENDNPDGEPLWHIISPLEDTSAANPYIVDFQNITRATPTVFEFSEDISAQDMELPALKTNGVSFYRLGSVGNLDNPISIISGSEKLRKGVNAWRLMSFVESVNREDAYYPSIDTWLNKTASEVETSYININPTRPVDVISNLSAEGLYQYRLSLTVYCPKQQSIKATPLCNYPFSIYMNTLLIYGGTTTGDVTYVFNEGWNQIDVLIYKNINSKNLTFNLNFDITKIGTKFYSTTGTMNLVSLFDLRYKTSSSNHNAYAITTINNENVVVVNDPTSGLQYEFSYKYAETLNTKGIILKAILKRDDSITSNTPKLQAYRIKFMA